MDAVRKLLYGGLRSTDSPGDTVLERTYLPADAHAWAQHYAGAEIAQLTPFSVNTSAPTGEADGSNSSYSGDSTQNVSAGTKYFYSGNVTVCVGDQVRAA